MSAADVRLAAIGCSRLRKSQEPKYQIRLGAVPQAVAKLYCIFMKQLSGGRQSVTEFQRKIERCDLVLHNRIILTFFIICFSLPIIVPIHL